MEFSLTTPALLFPAISLLLLAYTSRFLALAALIRSLQAQYYEHPDVRTMGQISNLRQRLRLIRDMQLVGVSSFFLCVLCMLLLFMGADVLSRFVFAFSLLLLLASLWLSVREIGVSIDALELQLSDFEQP